MVIASPNTVNASRSWIARQFPADAFRGLRIRAALRFPAVP